MQTFSVISISGGSPVMLAPLNIVLLVSMIKDAYEDYLRHKKDNEENDSKCTVMVNG